MLNSHRIPVGDLDDIATGRLTAPAAARIARAERSRRLLMFRAIAAADRGAVPSDGPLPPVAEAFDLLAQAERFSPEVVAEILAHPPVGVWAVRVLQRLRGAPAAAHEPPLWHELGYAHALAGAAALRSGLRATVPLPASSGTVTLPTLGQAVFPYARPGYGTATLHIDASPRVTLGPETCPLPPDPAAPAPTSPEGGADCRARSTATGLPPAAAAAGPAAPATSASSASVEPPAPPPTSTPPSALRPHWRSARRLSWSAGPTGPRLEDVDPYRDFRAPHPPPALAAPGAAERWQVLLDRASDVLVRRHPEAARMVALVLTALVPLPAMPRFRTSSASYAESFGSALITLPHDGVELAVTLVHEARHSALNGLDHQIQLVDPPAPDQETALLYAPWRSDPRPLWGLLHGVYAFTGVAEFWRTERGAPEGRAAGLAHFEFALLRGALAEVFATLPGRPGLTEWGRTLVGHLADRVASWREDPVPDHPLALAAMEGADLRATWRIRNLETDPADVRRAADGLLGGADPAREAAPRSRIRDGALSDSPEPRGELRRALLTDGPSAEAPAPAPYPGPAGLLDADLLLVRGDAADAARRYRTVLAEDPSCSPAWIGLGLALRGTDDPAGRALLARPEVVRAVVLEVRDRTGRLPDPLEPARWLARVPGLFAADAYG